MTMRWSLGCGLLLGTVFTFENRGFANEQVIQPDLSRIADGRSWKLINAGPTVVSEAGSVAGR
jgi:hypothetical protein